MEAVDITPKAQNSKNNNKKIGKMYSIKIKTFVCHKTVK